ncbi:hypothetical protein BGW39_010845, partial [Mortierella sp. 14UC]
SMGYTLVGFNMDEYGYKYNTATTSPQIAEVFNAVFSKQMDAYGRKASYIVAGYDVPTTGAASGLPKVINTIQAHAYDIVRLDGCTNDKTLYKKDPILNNGYVGDAKSFGALEYKHGQKSVNYTPGGNQQNKSTSPAGGSDGKTTQDTTSKSAGSRLKAVVSIMAVLPVLAFAYLF